MAKLLRLARFQFLIASLALYIAGAFLAVLSGSPFSWERILLGYLIILPGHLSVSFSNDYFDVGVDKYGSPAIFNGGSGVLVNHPELRRPARRIALALILCSLIVGCLFIFIFSFSIWILGYIALSDLLGWFYSAPPLKLSYRGLGEFSTAFTGGLLVPGMGYWVMKGSLDMVWVIFTIPMLLFGFAFILSVEIPDVEMDLLGHKRTWVVRMGRRRGFAAVGLTYLAATGFFFIFPWLSSYSFPANFRIFGLFSLLPLGASIIGWIKRPIDTKPATRMVNAIVVNLALFFILVDGYLVYLTLIPR
jgi:1,4-dihydroxy-2-naphthoate octaprenyltransferase